MSCLEASVADLPALPEPAQETSLALAVQSSPRMRQKRKSPPPENGKDASRELMPPPQAKRSKVGGARRKKKAGRSSKASTRAADDDDDDEEEDHWSSLTDAADRGDPGDVDEDEDDISEDSATPVVAKKPAGHSVHHDMAPHLTRSEHSLCGARVLGMILSVVSPHGLMGQSALNGV